MFAKVNGKDVLCSLSTLRFTNSENLFRLARKQPLVTINFPSPYVTEPKVELDPEVLTVHEDPSEEVIILPSPPTATNILFP